MLIVGHGIKVSQFRSGTGMHKEILDERQQRIADGTAQFEDWETAKAKIREKVR